MSYVQCRIWSCLSTLSHGLRSRSLGIWFSEIGPVYVTADRKLITDICLWHADGNGEPGTEEHLPGLTFKNCNKHQSRLGHGLSAVEENHQCRRLSPTSSSSSFQRSLSWPSVTSLRLRTSSGVHLPTSGVTRWVLMDRWWYRWERTITNLSVATASTGPIKRRSVLPWL